jgi:AraC family transcriptional regulator
VNRLPSLKKAVRVELYKRLSRAMDAIHAGVDTALSLDRLAVEACLSKYHFLRLFRQTYGLSPHQYIQQLRLEKAKSLLSDTQIPVADMAGMLGYKDGPSFSRLFAQRMGVYPSEYRAQIK